MGFLYSMVDKRSDASYPSYANVGAGAGEIHPNVTTFIGAVNKSQPILKAQYELTFSRWPRTIFFAKSVTIPGLTANTIDINHAGFTIPIATHVTYETTEITLNILADKEGYHYYDFRNFVFQSGHPLVAGDPMSTIGNNYNLNGRFSDYIDIKLRNTPEDRVYHHWIVNNFRPTGLSDLEVGHEEEGFMEFEVTGTFTHINYDCGPGFEEVPNGQPADTQDEKKSEPNKKYNTVYISSSNLDSSNGGDSTDDQDEDWNSDWDGDDSTNGHGGHGGGGSDSSSANSSSNADSSLVNSSSDSTSGGGSSAHDSSSPSSDSQLSSSSIDSSTPSDNGNTTTPSNDVDEITLRNIDTSLQWSGNFPIDATIVNMLRLKNLEGTNLTNQEIEHAKTCQSELEAAGKALVSALSRIRDTMQPDPDQTTKYVTKVLGGTTYTPRPQSDGNNDLVRNQVVVRVGISSQEQQDAFDQAVQTYLTTSEDIKNRYLQAVSGSRGMSLMLERTPVGFEIFDLQIVDIEDDDERLDQPETRVVDNIPTTYLNRSRFTEFRWKGKVVDLPKSRSVMSPELELIVYDYQNFSECSQVSFVYSYPFRVKASSVRASFTPTVCVSLMNAERKRSQMEQALAKEYMKKANYETLKLMNGVQNLSDVPGDESFSPVQMEIPFLSAMEIPVPSQTYPDFDKIEVGGTIECTIYSERQKQYIQDVVQQAQKKLDDLFLKYRELKLDLINFEFGETEENIPHVGKMQTSEEIENIQTLAKAIRYNHGITDIQTIDMSVNQGSELDRYNLKITQLTLPHRFGMYREQKRGVPVKTPVELEDPLDELQEREISQDELENRGAKIRKIF